MPPAAILGALCHEFRGVKKRRMDHIRRIGAGRRRRLSSPPSYDGPDQQLTRERAEAVAGPHRQLILTFVNSVRLDFATTWVHHVRRIGLTNWLVGATDPQAL